MIMQASRLKKEKEAEGTCVIKCKVHCYTSLVFLARRVRPLNVNGEEGSCFPFCFSFNSKELICSVLSLLRPLLLFIPLLCCVILRSRCARIKPPNFLSACRIVTKKGAKWLPRWLIPTASVIYSAPQENIKSPEICSGTLLTVCAHKSSNWHFID